ncbi:hypothetical protein [Mangrovibacterium sp.]|uniref:hypothetical protein n=1 Tax=Mangrovibacterium sp. TaxID=1961364 RepID=UPI003563A085
MENYYLEQIDKIRKSDASPALQLRAIKGLIELYKIRKKNEEKDASMKLINEMDPLIKRNQ